MKCTCSPGSIQTCPHCAAQDRETQYRFQFKDPRAMTKEELFIDYLSNCVRKIECREIMAITKALNF